MNPSGNYYLNRNSPKERQHLFLMSDPASHILYRCIHVGVSISRESRKGMGKEALKIQDEEYNRMNVIWMGRREQSRGGPTTAKCV